MRVGPAARPLRGVLAAPLWGSGLLLAFGSARCGRSVGRGANGEHLEPGPVPAAGGSRKNPAQRASLRIAFGLLLKGSGHVWLADVQFEIVGPDAPATGKPLTRVQERPINLEFSE